MLQASGKRRERGRVGGRKREDICRVPGTIPGGEAGEQNKIKCDYKNLLLLTAIMIPERNIALLINQVRTFKTKFIFESTVSSFLRKNTEYYHKKNKNRDVASHLEIHHIEKLEVKKRDWGLVYINHILIG